jgi:hypothetical protein
MSNADRFVGLPDLLPLSDEEKKDVAVRLYEGIDGLLVSSESIASSYADSDYNVEDDIPHKKVVEMLNQQKKNLKFLHQLHN